ncbi:MAG TPA: LysE family transporter [Syntrophorhabdaceae bacterium]|nr:LysE family transporter [Syntrophorhabdaceae bacterium]
MNLSTLFSVGFVLGLTGAMAPGPLLTVTISQSAKRGGITGPLLVLGHGILELALLILFVFGVGNLLKNPLLFAAISFCGGIVIVYMGIGIIRSLKTYTLVAGPTSKAKELHPILSGIIVSLSNPYWFIWWATIGMGYVMFAKALGVRGVLAFFAGHISSDLVWYTFVSYGISIGGKYFSTKIIKIILFACSIFLILFGLLFVANGFKYI